jgi:hypothetical protein
LLLHINLLPAFGCDVHLSRFLHDHWITPPILNARIDA